MGSFIFRIGMGGVPFLLPLLYQVGFGYSPLQSGLLIMPQSLAAMALKAKAQVVLSRFGYRKVLLTNTCLVGLLMLAFAAINLDTPVWVIVLLTTFYGFFVSLQYTSMNTLVYADIDDVDTSMASTMLSTVQQMSLSFGVATAGLVTAAFIPDRYHSSPAEMIGGMRKAFLILGGFTVLSAFIFRVLKDDDAENISQRKHAAAAVVENPA
jgi:nitrate/nitrite transporter NarK